MGSVRRTGRDWLAVGSILLAVAATVVWAAPGSSAAPSVVGSAEPDVTGAEAAALARRAATDDDALADLRAVRSVDGRPVDLRAVTADLGADRVARLTALAAALDRSGGPTGAEDAREAARDVLADRKFRSKPVPRPFRGLLEALARPLRPVLRRVGGWFRPILDLPGGSLILFTLLVAAGSAAIGLMISRRSRATVLRSGRGSGLVDPDADPDDLDAAADRAEAAGDPGAAVRFRYEAGLIRLVRADRIDLRVETTASDVARQVDLPAMSALTTDFEQIVYGGRPATAADVDRARTGWAEVVGVRARR